MRYILSLIKRTFLIYKHKIMLKYCTHLNNKNTKELKKCEIRNEKLTQILKIVEKETNRTGSG